FGVVPSEVGVKLRRGGGQFAARQQLGQQVAQFVQCLYSVHASQASGLRIIGGQLGSGKFFADQVVSWQKENFGISARGFGGRAAFLCWQDQQRRAGLSPAGEVIKVVVLAESVEAL